MKTSSAAAKEYAIAMGADPKKCINQTYDGYTEGASAVQLFIPLEEEKPPYGEDILVQTPAGSIYFGKMEDGISGRPDFLKIDCSEDTVSIKSIKSWRPIFYE